MSAMSVASFRSTSSITDLLDDIQAQGGQPKLKGRVQPRDFTRENIVRLRQLSASKKREKQSETSKLQPLKVDWKLSNPKYEHVTSKVSQFCNPTSNRKNGTCIEAKGNFKPVVPPLLLNQENEDPDKRRRLPTTDKMTLITGKSSHVKQNAMNAKFTPLKRCNSASDLDSKKDQHMPGFVPKYLIERKKQILMQREKERAEKEERRNALPKGQTLMSDEERIETLKLMREGEKKLFDKLASMPVNLATLRLRKEKEQIEQQLAKLEEGIKIFSRSKVYIKNE